MTTLQEDLLKCTVDGNVISLPDINSTQLEDYPALRKALLNSGGKYKRSTFIFNTDAQPYVDRIMNGNGANLKKEFQFFYTPNKIVERMIDEINFNYLSGVIRFLEPSAGKGHIIKPLLLHINKLNRERSKHNNHSLIDLEIDCCELEPINAKTLEENGHRLVSADFMELNTSKKYDLILANPPFTKGQDISHIMKMYDLLKTGGQLITISSSSWLFREQKNYADFKEFINDRAISYYRLPEGSFKESGTKIDTMLISLTK